MRSFCSRLFLAVLGLSALLLLSCSGGVDPPSTGLDGERTTVTLAVLDDAARRSALYALERGIVASERVDVAISYLPASAALEAVAAGRYDVVETTPLLLTASGAGEADYVLLSAGQVDLDGTLLFTQAGSPLAAPPDLRGRTLGVASLAAVSTLEARYVLEQKYGLAAMPFGGDLSFREAPGETLMDLLQRGEVAGAVLPPAGAFELLDDSRYRVVSHLAQEYSDLTGAPAAATVLLTYRDAAQAKRAALEEVTRLLAASLAYFSANEDEVIEAVAGQGATGRDALRWWWRAHRLEFGPVSRDQLARVRAVWEAARMLGDIRSYPDPPAIVGQEEARAGHPAAGLHGRASSH